MTRAFVNIQCAIIETLVLLLIIFIAQPTTFVCGKLLQLKEWLEHDAP